jgi:hypothetical protein
MHSPGFQAGGGPYGGGGMSGGGGPTSAAAALGGPFGPSGKRARTGEKASYASSIAGDNGLSATSGSAACWPHRDDYYAMHTPVASGGMVSSIIPHKNTRFQIIPLEEHTHTHTHTHTHIIPHKNFKSFATRMSNCIRILSSFLF